MDERRRSVGWMLAAMVVSYVLGLLSGLRW